MPKKLDQDFVAKSFAERGCFLLDKYKNNSTRMRYRCPFGHLWAVTWREWRLGAGCAFCGNRVVTHRHVKEEFKKHGYKLLSTYRKSSMLLNFICPEGHNHNISWNAFYSGQRCGKCRKPNVDPNFVEKAFLDRGYTPLNRYSHPFTKIEYLCPQGHQHAIIWDAFRTGKGCPYCTGQKLTEEQKIISIFKKRIRSRVNDAIVKYKSRGISSNPRFSSSEYGKKIAGRIAAYLGSPPFADSTIDHIVPQSFFDMRDQKERDACWSNGNLRWLSKSLNSGRKNKLTIQEIESFNKKQLCILAAASLRPPEFDEYLKQQKIKFSPSKMQRQDSLESIQIKIPGI